MATDGRSAAGTALPCRRRHGQRQQQRPGQEPRHGLWTSLDQDLDLRRTMLLKMILVAHFDAVFASEHNVKYIYIYIFTASLGGVSEGSTQKTLRRCGQLWGSRGDVTMLTHTQIHFSFLWFIFRYFLIITGHIELNSEQQFEAQPRCMLHFNYILFNFVLASLLAALCEYFFFIFIFLGLCWHFFCFLSTCVYIYFILY